jgi:hypothetical protein
LKRILTSQNVIDKKINESTSFDIGKVADRIAEELKLTKSRKIYEQQYKGFVKWCMEKRLGNYNENALLVYFKVKSKVLRFHTLVVNITCTVNSINNDL